MKSVGIITVHRLPNWGSAMQGYALQKVISSLGYDSECVDYLYPNKWHIERGSWIPSKGSFKKKIARFLGLCPPHLQSLVDGFVQNEVKTSRRYLSFEELHDNPPVYDIYVSGSDQIWNWKSMCADPSYLLDFVPDGKMRVAYASSFSVTDIPEKYIDLYKSNLRKFKALSTREYNGAKIIKNLLDIDIPVVLDPTMLISKEHWGELAKKAVWKKQMPEKYILCYLLDYTYNPRPAMASLLRKLQRQFKCPVILLGREFPQFDGEVFKMSRSQGIGVYEFLWLVKNATIFATSSFHGTAFSVKMGTPFLSMIEKKGQKDDRIESFLKEFGLSDHLVTIDMNYDNWNVDGTFNEDSVNQIMETKRNFSLDYLRNALL